MCILYICYCSLRLGFVGPAVPCLGLPRDLVGPPGGLKFYPLANRIKGKYFSVGGGGCVHRKITRWAINIVAPRSVVQRALLLSLPPPPLPHLASNHHPACQQANIQKQNTPPPPRSQTHPLMLLGLPRGSLRASLLGALLLVTTLLSPLVTGAGRTFSNLPKDKPISGKDYKQLICAPGATVILKYTDYITKEAASEIYRKTASLSVTKASLTLVPDYPFLQTDSHTCPQMVFSLGDRVDKNNGSFYAEAVLDPTNIDKNPLIYFSMPSRFEPGLYTLYSTICDTRVDPVDLFEKKFNLGDLIKKIDKRQTMQCKSHLIVPISFYVGYMTITFVGEPDYPKFPQEHSFKIFVSLVDKEQCPGSNMHFFLQSLILEHYVDKYSEHAKGLLTSPIVKSTDGKKADTRISTLMKSGGAAEFKITLPENLPTGDYIVVVQNESGKYLGTSLPIKVDCLLSKYEMVYGVPRMVDFHDQLERKDDLFNKANLESFISGIMHSNTTLPRNDKPTAQTSTVLRRKITDKKIEGASTEHNCFHVTFNTTHNPTMRLCTQIQERSSILMPQLVCPSITDPWKSGGDGNRIVLISSGQVHWGPLKIVISAVDLRGVAHPLASTSTPSKQYIGKDDKCSYRYIQIIVRSWGYHPGPPVRGSLLPGADLQGRRGRLAEMSTRWTNPELLPYSQRPVGNQTKVADEDSVLLKPQNVHFTSTRNDLFVINGPNTPDEKQALNELKQTPRDKEKALKEREKHDRRLTMPYLSKESSDEWRMYHFSASYQDGLESTGEPTRFVQRIEGNKNLSPLKPVTSRAYNGTDT